MGSNKRICNLLSRFRPPSARYRSIRRIRLQKGLKQRGRARPLFFEKSQPLQSPRKMLSVPSSMISDTLFGILRPASVHLPFPPWWPLRPSGLTAVCSVAGEYINGPSLVTPLFRSHTLFFVCVDASTLLPWSTSLYNRLFPPLNSPALCRTKTGKVVTSSNRWFPVLKVYGDRSCIHAPPITSQIPPCRAS